MSSPAYWAVVLALVIYNGSVVAELVRFTNWRAQVRAAEAAQLELTRTYDFNPGNIISDGLFFNGNALSEQQVNAIIEKDKRLG